MTKKEKDATKVADVAIALDGADTGEDDGVGEIASPAESAPAPAIETRPAPSGLVKALVLRSCGFGEVGTVALLDQAEADTGADQGALDLSPAAVRSVAG